MNPVLLDSCYSCFHAPDHPSTPFAGEALLFDILRVVVLLASLVMLVCTVLSVRRSQLIGQRIRIASTSCLVILTAGTELSHLGDLGHWRLGVALFGTVLGAWGLVAFLLYELPSSPERMARHDRWKAKRRAWLNRRR